MSGETEDFDLLAAIYALGALELDEARAVEELAAREGEVARSIEDWQNRLAPLAAGARPHPPPTDLWQRIEASIGLERDVDEAPVVAPEALPPASPPVARFPRRAWRSVHLWRGATAAMAMAAAAAGIALLNRPEPVPYAAALAPAGSPGAAFIAEMRSDGSLMVRPLAPVQVASGRDLELWAMPEGGQKPVSLGILPAIGRKVPMQGMPHAPMQLLVSLEPTGGSPTGEPTGPVVYSGVLKEL